MKRLCFLLLGISLASAVHAFDNNNNEPVTEPNIGINQDDENTNPDANTIPNTEPRAKPTINDHGIGNGGNTGGIGTDHGGGNGPAN